MTHPSVARSFADLPSRRGPGIIESLGWTLGYWVAQGVAAIGLVVLLVLFAFEGWPRDLTVIDEIVGNMSSADVVWLTMYLTGGATLGALFLVVPPALLRLRPSPRQKLSPHRPDGRQLVLLGGVVLPLAILCDEVYRAATLLWTMVRTQIVSFWPAIEQFGQQDTIALLQDQTTTTAYPLLLVIVGVGPAIGEELIFRGVIGRGLVNRLGVVRGVLLTSLLFAVAHGSPAHALATLPLAVFLHLTYLATRTIWAPIIVHFLNNALSITMLKYQLGQNVDVSVLMLVSAAVYVTAIGILLWRTRDDTSTVELEQPSLPTLPQPSVTRSVASPQWLTLVASLGVMAFTWTFVSAAVAMTP